LNNSTLRENGVRDFSLSGEANIPDVNDNSYCINDLNDVVSSGSRKIGYYHSNSVSITDKEFGHLVLCNTDGSYLDNVDIVGSYSLSNNGLTMIRTRDSVLKRVDSNNNYMGIFMSECEENEIWYTNTNRNTHTGIWLRYSDGNYFDGGSSNENYPFKSSSVYEGGGIRFEQSNGNIFVRYDVLENGKGYTEESQIMSGVSVGKGCAGNGIAESRIGDNYDVGIVLRGDAVVNLIRNNILVNKINFYYDSQGSSLMYNEWNHDLEGENIVGGPNISGNYWGASPPGNYGYSDLCDDDNLDGFCDLPYDVEHDDSDCSDTNNCDYKPLKIPD